MNRLKIISSDREGYGAHNSYLLEEAVNAFCENHDVISIVPMCVETPGGRHDIQVFITYRESDMARSLRAYLRDNPGNIPEEMLSSTNDNTDDAIEEYF